MDACQTEAQKAFKAYEKAVEVTDLNFQSHVDAIMSLPGSISGLSKAQYKELDIRWEGHMHSGTVYAIFVDESGKRSEFPIASFRENDHP